MWRRVQRIRSRHATAHQDNMYVRPSRQAHGRRNRDTDSANCTAEYSLLVSEMNCYYRVGVGCWYTYKEGNEKPKLWPFVVTKIFSKVGRADMIKLKGKLLYNGKYLDDRCCSGYTQLRLPAEVRYKNIWFVSNIEVEVFSSQISSAFNAVASRYCPVMGITAFESRKRLRPTNQVEGVDPNGLPDEVLIVSGTVRLAPAQTRQLWRNELLRYEFFHSDTALQSVTNVLPANFNEELGDIMLPRCPWATQHPLPRVPRQLFLGGAAPAYDPAVGLLQIYRLPAGDIVRVVDSSSGDGTVLVSPCLTERRAAELFPSSPSLAAIRSGRVRIERTWLRTPSEVILCAPGANLDYRVPASILTQQCSTMYSAPPSFVPPLLTFNPTDDVAVHELAVVDRQGKVEPVAQPGTRVMMSALADLVLAARGPITKVAQNHLRLAVLSRALALKFDAENRFLTIEVVGFSLHKLFSLDVEASTWMCATWLTIWWATRSGARETKARRPRRSPIHSGSVALRLSSAPRARIIVLSTSRSPSMRKRRTRFCTIWQRRR